MPMKSKDINKKYGQKLIWCLEEGNEQCEHCLGFYYSENGYFCSECDSPVCQSCAIMIRETNQVICPDCHGKKEE